MVRLIIVFSLLLVICNFSASSNVIKKMMINSAKLINECKQEMNIPDDVLLELYHFFKASVELPRRSVGCAMLCLSKKLNMTEESAALHYGNTKEFAIKCGADEDTAHKFVSGIQDCLKDNANHEDACIQALVLTRCYRDEMNIFRMTQTLSVVAAEVASEV